MRIIALLATIFAAANALDWMDYQQIKAIDQNFDHRYWMNVKYGPNNMGWFGTYAYIYFEVGGAAIEDGAVVTTFATV